MNNPECKYLFDILENTFVNCKPDVLRGDCRAELVNAVEGIDQLFTEMKERIDRLDRSVKILADQIGEHVN